MRSGWWLSHAAGGWGAVRGERHLVLVGAGHAHLHVIAQVDQLRRSGYRVTLVAPRWFDYSGTASGVATGTNPSTAGRIDIAALTSGRLAHRQTTATAVDLRGRTLTTSEFPAEVIEWDVLSINIGSMTRPPSGLPIADSVMAVKPLSDLVALRERLAQPARHGAHRVTVIGAGASGIELAAQLSMRSDTAVCLLESGERIAPGLPPSAVRRLSALLSRRGVLVRTGVRVAEIGEEEVRLADGTRLPHDVVVLATGLAPPPLATEPELGGPDGIPVRATLQHRDHDDVYAAGDCANFLPGTLPRVGVHGVRQGPVLLAALTARTRGSTPPVYRPQRRALSVLDLGGVGLAVRGRWWWLGRSSLLLKRWLDRRWVSRYQRGRG